MTTRSINWRRGLDFALDQPLRAALTHGNQALVTLASAYMNAQFAQSHNILDPAIAWLLAVGYEWTYLRGIASSDRAKSRWSSALNLVAFLTAIIGGLLYCADRYGALPAEPDDTTAWLLAAAHVLPMALLSLCSAMVHRAAAIADRAERDQVAEQERERERRLQEQRDAIALEAEREQSRLQRWKEAQQFKVQLKQLEDASTMPAPMPAVPIVAPKTIDCPTCRHRVAYTSASEAGTIRRWGCPSCRARRKEG